MEMKRLFLLAGAVSAMVACTDSSTEYIYLPTSDECTANHIETVSFEADEMMKGVDGQYVMLGDADVAGSFAGGIYPNVYWFESLTGASDMLDENGSYDGPLFSTANENIWFGHIYSTGQYGDSWGGFALSADYTRRISETGYYQFTVWPDRGACGSSTCAIGYCNFSGTYGIPTIDFVKQPRTVCHCYLANTMLAYEYTPSAAVEPAEYYYRVVIAGELDGVQTGTVVCTLVQGRSRVNGWVKVDLTPLGKVDKLTFTPESNDESEYDGVKYLNVPAYFALDEIGLLADR